MRSRLLFLCCVLAAAAVAGLAGYRVGLGRAFLRDKRAAESPEPVSQHPAEWSGPRAGHRSAEATAATQGGPAHQAENPPSVESSRPPEGPAPAAPFALDATRPVRITWPLEVGPDWSPDRPDARLCLRSREKANEVQNPGAAFALYPFRLAEGGRYRAWCRVRWTDDGEGSIECNNSWFAGFDDMPAAVVGNEEWRTDWFWEQGPSAELAAGTHWLRIELREDGPCMDRVAMVREGTGSARFPAELDGVKVVEFAAFAGERPPGTPQRPVEAAEFWALPTGSLAIGAGHSNEITLGASWQGGEPFSGTVEVSCPTAPGLKVTGTREVAVGPGSPFARSVLALEFPAGAARRPHEVLVAVSDPAGRIVFRESIRFVRPFAWAFLGPFADTGGGEQKVLRGTGSIRSLKHPCDKDPRLLARMRPKDELGLADAQPVASAKTADWKLVADGSACDWTGAVDLHRVWGRVEPAFAYAVTWINAETRLHHRSFNFQVDDSGWLWVNGDIIAALPVNLPKEANRLWSSAQLEPGPNPVVVKLTQDLRYWGFRFDVIDWHWQGRRGDVITGVEPGNWPRE